VKRGNSRNFLSFEVTIIRKPRTLSQFYQPSTQEAWRRISIQLANSRLRVCEMRLLLLGN
jgi:hypothetical protein